MHPHTHYQHSLNIDFKARPSDLCSANIERNIEPTDIPLGKKNQELISFRKSFKVFVLYCGSIEVYQSIYLSNQNKNKNKTHITKNRKEIEIKEAAQLNILNCYLIFENFAR